jgi:hypothetical protein
VRSQASPSRVLRVLLGAVVMAVLCACSIPVFVLFARVVVCMAAAADVVSRAPVSCLLHMHDTVRVAGCEAALSATPGHVEVVHHTVQTAAPIPAEVMVMAAVACLVR